MWVWYFIIVCIQSWYICEIIWQVLEDIFDCVVEELFFKLYDFGLCGVSSCESVGIGGLVYFVNFQGSDILEVLWVGCNYYGVELVGFFIFVVEYFIIISWGKEYEVDVYCNMVWQFGKFGKVYVVVLDSYDLKYVINVYWGEILWKEVEESGGILVVCFDFGDFLVMVCFVVNVLVVKYGIIINFKGFKVL